MIQNVAIALNVWLMFEVFESFCFHVIEDHYKKSTKLGANNCKS